MGLRWFLAILLMPVLGQCEELWVIEQDFVKFGKKEVFEKTKRELLDASGKTFLTFAAQEDDLLQYVFFVAVDTYRGLGNFLQKSADPADADVKAAYSSTLNFLVRSLNAYLPECSYVPEDREAMTGYSHLFFYLFGITPGNEGIFESQLQKVASAQTGICFRCWKVLMGSDAPKYFVAVFGDSEKQTQKSAESIEFVPFSMKNILRSKKTGKAVLRKDLSRS